MEPILQPQPSQDPNRNRQAPAPANSASIPRAKMPANPAGRDGAPAKGGQTVTEDSPQTVKVSLLRLKMAQWFGMEIPGVQNPQVVSRTQGNQVRREPSNEAQVVDFAQTKTTLILSGALQQLKESGADLLVKAGKTLAYVSDNKLAGAAMVAGAVGVAAAAFAFPAVAATFSVGTMIYHSGLLSVVGGPSGLFGAIAAANREADPVKRDERWSDVGRESLLFGASALGTLTSVGGALKGGVVGKIAQIGNTALQIGTIVARSAPRERSTSASATPSEGALSSAVDNLVVEGRAEVAAERRVRTDSVAKPLVDAAMFVFNQFAAERGVALTQTQKTAARNLYIDVALEWKTTLEMQTASRDVASDLGTVGSTLSQRQRSLFSDITGQFYSEIQRRWSSSGSPGDENALRLDAETLRRLDPRVPGQDGQIIDVKGRTLTILESPKDAPKKWGNR